MQAYNILVGRLISSSIVLHAVYSVNGEASQPLKRGPACGCCSLGHGAHPAGRPGDRLLPPQPVLLANVQVMISHYLRYLIHLYSVYRYAGFRFLLLIAVRWHAYLSSDISAGPPACCRRSIFTASSACIKCMASCLRVSCHRTTVDGILGHRLTVCMGSLSNIGLPA